MERLEVLVLLQFLPNLLMLVCPEVKAVVVGELLRLVVEVMLEPQPQVLMSLLLVKVMEQVEMVQLGQQVGQQLVVLEVKVVMVVVQQDCV
tara:strand:+ start:504 stop:776 length:273 start_codon:yes stop_codon:yes gene_type:complete